MPFPSLGSRVFSSFYVEQYSAAAYGVALVIYDYGFHIKPLPFAVGPFPGLMHAFTLGPILHTVASREQRRAHSSRTDRLCGGVLCYVHGLSCCKSGLADLVVSDGSRCVSGRFIHLLSERSLAVGRGGLALAANSQCDV